MEIRIADTFAPALARLDAPSQKAAKTTAFDLQINPASHGLHFHRIERSRDANFWSLRAGSDVRIIVHRTPGSLLLAYVDHHVYRPRLMKHREGAYAASAAGESRARRTVSGVRYPSRWMSQVVL
jgi:mRNA-degrading endonuclease RelE of RelBE toxin-antitoxin system